jgi:hypothetical protein
MASIIAASADDYLAQLPPERRAIVSAVRDVIRTNLPPGYEEAPAYGMIGYAVPLAHYPNTYNGQPLCYAALAAQKNHYALYLMRAYGDPRQAALLSDAFARIGKKLDMGKSCIRFAKLEDLPLDAIGAFIASAPVDAFIAEHERIRAASKAKRAARSGTKNARAGKTAKKQARKATSSRRGGTSR